MRPLIYGITTDSEGNVVMGQRTLSDVTGLHVYNDQLATVEVRVDNAETGYSAYLTAKRNSITDASSHAGMRLLNAAGSAEWQVGNRGADNSLTITYSSDGTTFVDEITITTGGAFTFNEDSNDRDFRVETGGMAYAIYADGGKDALVLGSNTDTSSADQLITVSRAARSNTSATNYYDLRVAPAGAVTTTGVTAIVSTVSLVEPNITVSSDSVTRAATLHIASQPTEAGTANAAIYFGAAANIAGTTSLTINDDSEDLDFRVETNGMAYAVYSDGGKDALVLGSNTDTSSADQLITVSRAARTATATVNYFDLAMAPAGAVTVPAGTTAVVAEVSIAEPNITISGSTVTRAATLYIASQPTEGGTANAAILFGAAANIACTTSLTFNEDSEDIDFRFEGANNTTMLVLDGGTDSAALGGSVVAGTFLVVNGSTVNRAGVTAIGRHIHVPAVTITQTNADPTTLAIGAGVSIGIPTFAGANANQTIDAAASVYIAGAAAQGSNMILTSGYALWVDAGVTRLDGNLDMSDAALDIVVKAATAAALEISDGTTKFYAVDTRVGTAGVTSHTFNISAYTFASAATNIATALSVPAHTLNYTGTTQVTSEVVSVNIGARTIAGDTATLTVDKASTLNLQAPIEGTNITLTATSALRIVTTTGSPTTQYGIFIESLTGGGTNRGIYLAGANGIQFAAADDIVIPAATAAALEISDGTTKFYAFDTRVATAGVTTHALDISDYTFASGATNVATGLSLAAHTLNYTGNTQVTTQVDTVVLGARTIAGDTATLTVDESNTLLLVAPTEGTNVVITAASALRIVDAGGTPTNQYGIYIETLTAGATADYAIWVAGANAVHLGTAGTATGLLEIDGATSGTMTLTVPTATTSYTLTLPPAANTNVGYQLTCAAGDTITSWGAAASIRGMKNIKGEHDAQDALDKILAARVYDFRYKKGQGTQDSKTDYVGLMADEAPWAMHYAGGVVNPVNTLGYTVLAFQAMADKVARLEAKLASIGA